MDEMTLAEWDGLAPVAAAVALVVLALLPDPPADGGGAPDAGLASLDTAGAGEELPWRDPATGQSGVIVPAALWRDQSGQWCRDYSITLATGEGSSGVACRLAQGSWQARAVRPSHARQPAEQLAASPD